MKDIRPPDVEEIAMADQWFNANLGKFRHMREHVVETLESAKEKYPDISEPTWRAYLAAQFAMMIENMMEDLLDGGEAEVDFAVADEHGKMLDDATLPDDVREHLEELRKDPKKFMSKMFAHEISSMLAMSVWDDGKAEVHKEEISMLNDMFKMDDFIKGDDAVVVDGKAEQVTDTPEPDLPEADSEEVMTPQEQENLEEVIESATPDFVEAPRPEADYDEVVDPEVLPFPDELLVGTYVAVRDGRFGKLRRITDDGKYVVAIPGEVEVEYFDRTELEAA